MKRQLAEAEAALESQTRKKPPVDTGPRVVGEGLVIDEWVQISYLLSCLLLHKCSFEFSSYLTCFISFTLVSFRKSEGRNTWLDSRLKR